MATSQEVYDEAQAILKAMNDLQQRALKIIDPLLSDELTLAFDGISTILATTWGATQGTDQTTPNQIDEDARAALAAKFPEKT